MNPAAQVFVSGVFDDIRARDIRFLEEASRIGPVTVLLHAAAAPGSPEPRFPLAERLYFLQAVRYVHRVLPLAESPMPDTLPSLPDLRGAVWVDREHAGNPGRAAHCQRQGLAYHVVPASAMEGFPEPTPPVATPGRRKAVATGCYDWFHSGHVRFTEEASACGDLYVIVGHDANIRLLKGEGHPLLPAVERRYVVGSIRFVHQALISTGEGWLDADPEIRRIQPDCYVVNEDGDKGGKREYCAQRGIEYVVLRRTPAPGLPRRSSTDLRGF